MKRQSTCTRRICASTSSCLPEGSSAQRTGLLSARTCATSRLVTSAPALARPPLGRGDQASRRDRRHRLTRRTAGLAGPVLSRVRAPTLLIVGGKDVQVVQLNRAALAQLLCEKQIGIVPGATHFFEEPGALDEVARLAREWFGRHLFQTTRRGAQADPSGTAARCAPGEAHRDADHFHAAAVVFRRPEPPPQASASS